MTILRNYISLRINFYTDRCSFLRINYDYIKRHYFRIHLHQGTPKNYRIFLLYYERALGINLQYRTSAWKMSYKSTTEISGSICITESPKNVVSNIVWKSLHICIREPPKNHCTIVRKNFQDASYPPPENFLKYVVE